MTIENYDQDHKLRQLSRMRDVLDEYRAGNIDLSTLIARLESLNAALDKMPASWQNEFDRSWGTLEELHAVMLDRSERNLSQSGADLVKESVELLEALIESELAR